METDGHANGQLAKREFDHSKLHPDQKNCLTEERKRIDGLTRRTARDLVEIGLSLTRAKASVGHGMFLDWVDCCFGWDYRTASRFMLVSTKYDNLSDLSYATSALYLLASPSTTDQARAEAQALADSGEVVTHAKAREIIARPGGKKPPKPPKPTPDKGDAYEGPADEKEAAEDRAAKAAGDAPRDATGYEIPRPLRGTFKSPFWADALAAVREMRKHIMANQLAYHYLNFQLAVRDLGNLEELLTLCRPYAVHRECGGKGCKKCRNSGYLSKQRHTEMAATGG